MKRTSTSLVLSRSVSTCQAGLMSQLKTTPRRRLEGQDPSPPTLAAVDATVVEMTADARLEHSLGDLDTEHVVLSRLEATEVLGEHAKRILDRRVHDD